MRFLARLFRDPLLHFLIAGAVLYGVVSRHAPPAAHADANVIAVDRAAMLTFIQYRSKAFEAGAAERLFGALSPDERRRLVDDYVREEALYREAKALGVAENDYVIRERMVQSAAFLADAAAGAPAVSDRDAEAYLATHKSDYSIEPSVTFAHVFFAGPEAEAKARAAVARLNRAGAKFEDAPRYGDRFPFHVNYVERTYDYVASQFGDAAAKTVFDAATPLDVWAGPLQSEYGWHAVLVTARAPARDPQFSEIRDRVVDDARRARADAARERAVADIVGRYKVVRAKDLDAPPLEVPAPAAPASAGPSPAAPAASPAAPAAPS